MPPSTTARSATTSSSARSATTSGEKIRAGKFLIKSLHQRQETILSIGRQIVERQREFMEKGVAGLKPMTMIQVAEVVGVHETTVSRAVSGKYMQTPQGIFEMKYFFTSGIQTAAGDMSNTSVESHDCRNVPQRGADQTVVRPGGRADAGDALKRAAGDAKEPVVVVNADANATHQSVIRVMEAARLAGFVHLTFATQSPPK